MVNNNVAVIGNLETTLTISTDNKSDKDNAKNDDGETRRPILCQALHPYLKLLKVFGMFYENPKSDTEYAKCLAFLHRGYCYLVFSILVFCLVKSIVVIWFLPDNSSNTHYLVGWVVVYRLKCVIQAFSCLRASPRCTKNMLPDFTRSLHTFLCQIKICDCRIAEKKFRRRVHSWLYVYTVIIIIYVALRILARVKYPGNKDYAAVEHIIWFPFSEVSALSELILLPFEAVCFVAYFLPAALCGVLTQTLVYAFNEYYRYLEFQKKNGLICLRSYIREMREKYLQLSEFVNTLDDLVAWIFMISYSTDIIMICLSLRVVISFTTTVGKLMFLVWLLPPLFTLLSLSAVSSKLYDQGSKMMIFVQKLKIPDNVNISEKVQLDLLLFNVTSDPVVLTIWGMVPLNKSIIISIFVSIITYFALLISF